MPDVFIGQIKSWGYGFCPQGWLPCDGRTISLGQNDGKYNALISIIWDRYGGDGRTTFALPDLRARVQMGQDWSTAQLAARGGEASNVMKQTPSHQHYFSIMEGTGVEEEPAGNMLASSIATGDEYFFSSVQDTTLHPDTVKNAGASAPIDNMQPYLAVNYCINWDGYYPQRN